MDSLSSLTPQNTTLKGKVSFNYWLKRVDGKPIRSEHEEGLVEKAVEFILEQINEGFREGELCDFIRVDDTDPEDGSEHRGGWESYRESGICMFE